ncbi:hypothetical protein NUW58_g6653 [Xylaria curta]|uniref:Uncharacterized protein n=1 Tax=Xylaria curta TaxID=42375 RepID=A0ACC1NQI6_9PEZI|nr:hypothetical protein NUW58_g6653 [Xylaria curta]
MSPRRTKKRRVSSEDKQSQDGNGSPARQGSASPSQQQPVPLSLQPSPIITARSPSPVIEQSTPTGLGIRDAPQASQALQHTPDANNSTHYHAPVPRMPRNEASQDDYIRSLTRQALLAPRNRQPMYDDARDYLTPEQQQHLRDVPGLRPMGHVSTSFHPPARRLSHPYRRPLPSGPLGRHSSNVRRGLHRVGGGSSYSFRPDIRDPVARSRASFLPNLHDGADDETPDAASIPRAIIMNDNYDVLNPDIMARVAQQCEDPTYRNTSQAIATYHQLEMADDLHYSGKWKGRFMVNQSSIFEHHNAPQSRPETQGNDLARTDRRLRFRLVQFSDGETGWVKVFDSNLCVRTSSMQCPPAEYENTLDLYKYFFARAPGNPSIERYAQLVAPGYIDDSPAAIAANQQIVGMLPGADSRRAALRVATEAQASSAEALAAPHFIPTVTFNDSVSSDANTPPGRPLLANNDIASGSTTAPPSIPHASMDSGATGTHPGQVGILPNQGGVFSRSFAYDNTLLLGNTNLNPGTATSGPSHLNYTGAYPNSNNVYWASGTGPSAANTSALMTPPVDPSISWGVGDSHFGYANAAANPANAPGSLLASPNPFMGSTLQSPTASQFTFFTPDMTPTPTSSYYGHLYTTSNPGMTSNTAMVPGAPMAPVSSMDWAPRYPGSSYALNAVASANAPNLGAVTTETHAEDIDTTFCQFVNFEPGAASNATASNPTGVAYPPGNDPPSNSTQHSGNTPCNCNNTLPESLQSGGNGDHDDYNRPENEHEINDGNEPDDEHEPDDGDESVSGVPNSGMGFTSNPSVIPLGPHGGQLPPNFSSLPTALSYSNNRSLGDNQTFATSFSGSFSSGFPNPIVGRLQEDYEDDYEGDLGSPSDHDEEAEWRFDGKGEAEDEWDLSFDEKVYKTKNTQGHKKPKGDGDAEGAV